MLWTSESLKYTTVLSLRAHKFAWTNSAEQWMGRFVWSTLEHQTRQRMDSERVMSILCISITRWAQGTHRKEKDQHFHKRTQERAGHSVTGMIRTRFLPSLILASWQCEFMTSKAWNASPSGFNGYEFHKQFPGTHLMRHTLVRFRRTMPFGNTATLCYRACSTGPV